METFLTVDQHIRGIENMGAQFYSLEKNGAYTPRGSAYEGRTLLFKASGMAKDADGEWIELSGYGEDTCSAFEDLVSEIERSQLN